MTSFENIITPIIFNGGKNIYALGLCLNGGRIHKIKLWNKIYDNSSVYHDYLYSFGGEECLKYYTNTKEWKKLHPGFSGFTVGVEFNYDSGGEIELKQGFGFKDFGFQNMILEELKSIMTTNHSQTLLQQKIKARPFL